MTWHLVYTKVGVSYIAHMNDDELEVDSLIFFQMLPA